MMNRFQYAAVTVTVGLAIVSPSYALTLALPDDYEPPPPLSTEDLILQELRFVRQALERANREKAPLVLHVDETSVECVPDHGDPFGCQEPARSLCEKIGYSGVQITRWTGVQSTKPPAVYEIVCYEVSFGGTFRFDVDPDADIQIPIIPSIE